MDFNICFPIPQKCNLKKIIGCHFMATFKIKTFKKPTKGLSKYRF